MFKYISEILAQFTKTQRIMALLMVLLAIVIITLTPSIITALESNSDVLKKQIARQNSRIENLENQIDTMDAKLRSQEMKCTDQIYTRETEFVQMLEDLKHDIKDKEKQGRPAKKYYVNMKRTEESNSAEMEMEMAKPIPTPSEEETPKNLNMSTIVQKIELMQKKMGKK
jgi:hypothetical protein